jgi:hypothetical protein
MGADKPRPVEAEPPAEKPEPPRRYRRVGPEDEERGQQTDREDRHDD